MTKWTVEDMPDQTGRTAVVTGPNSGLGYESALALAKKGAHVVMAGRSLSRCDEARDRVLAAAPDASAEVIPLDLASLESVREFADEVRERFDRLDILLNNAGLMAPPRAETADGFEMQFGVNHLGHFALTGLLLPRLLTTPGSRVVTITSFASLFGRLNLGDLNHRRSYHRYMAYSGSKLANLFFALELQRRLAAAGAATISVAAHPGLSHTNLQNATADASGSSLERRVYEVAMTTIGQNQQMGALPQLYAATAPGVRGGEFYGPSTFFIRGYPQRLGIPRQARDEATAARLWAASEEMTGVVYRFETVG